MNSVTVICRATLVFVLFLAVVQAAQAQAVSFNRDIRPLLSDRCFACHGPDPSHREADLRLDIEEGLFGEADDSGPVVRGKPDASELVRRISSADPDERMPPPEFGKDLSPAEIDVLRRWVEQGAPWEGHWAFQPIDRLEPPTVDGSNEAAHPVDAFVRATLADKGLEPAAEADRRTLIRRLSFDLLGLPPSPDEVDAFLADTTATAYESLVDRMLESPHYGERMALWWLDLVRYADTVGYHGDQPVSVSPFRDYVIRSFNDNKPFDQFTREQLAGDLFPEPTLEQRVASGYNRLGMMSAEGGVQPKEYLAKYIAERVRNVGGTWLGMTTGCCECHDHKYDPLTMKDFYSLEAFFADIEERGLYSGAHASGAWGASVQVPTGEQSQRLADFDRQLAETRQQLATAEPQLSAAQAEWEKSLAAWTVLKPDTMVSAGGVTLTRKDDLSILASGNSPATDNYTITILNPPSNVTALRLEVLPDDSLPKKGPGRAGNGNFVLTEFVVKVGASAKTDQAVKIARAEASFEQTVAGDKTPYGKWAIAGAIDDDPKAANYGWAILDQIGKANYAIFELTEAIAGGDGSTLTVELRQNHDNATHTLGRFRLLATSSPRPVRMGDVAPPEIAALLVKPAEARSSDELEKVAAHYRSIAPELESTRGKLKELETARAEVEKSITTTLVTVAVKPRTVRILPRGNWMDDSGQEVQPAFPAVLPSLEVEGERRLTRDDLALWLTSEQNPLTARVFANRMWKNFFGAGLSRKLDDLGAQGDWPTHPELLDWLAGQFIDSGWDVKHLARKIVTSATYRQTSYASDLLRESDPANLWLARQSSFRLDAELVRDNVLRVSGLLVPQLGGPSVKPYQPPGYWAYLNFPAREWQNGKGDALYRRGLYTHWQRQYLHPALLAFDAPSREECAAERTRSNTPLQTLVLLNDPTKVEAARYFAERVIREGGETPQRRLAWAYRQALARVPEPRESEVLLTLLENHRAAYDQDVQAARDLLSVGSSPAPSDLAAEEVAAWTSVTRAILNLHETITRD